MNFNYRDFFIHNDDLHIIKEQLSIIDEMPRVAKENALSSNAKVVWDKWTSLPDAQKDAKTIAEELKINVETVKKIIDICEKKFLENKTVIQIANEMKLTDYTIMQVLNNAIPDWKRTREANFIKDAKEIYNLHKQGKSPDEIVNLINQNRKPHLQINLDKVNLALKIVDIATKQMENKGHINAHEIERQINHTINLDTIIRLIKKLDIGKIKYKHKFTEEQDAFILFNYLQKIGLSELTRKFNEKFSTESKKLNIGVGSIYGRLKDNILKSNFESEISEYALNLIRDYKTEYFSTVNIEDPKTKELLKNYTPPETIKGKDKTGTGTNRDMSAHLGIVQTNFNTMVTNLRNAHTIR
jgi:hypothetical protein